MYFTDLLDEREVARHAAELPARPAVQYRFREDTWTANTDRIYGMLLLLAHKSFAVLLLRLYISSEMMLDPPADFELSAPTCFRTTRPPLERSEIVRMCRLCK